MKKLRLILVVLMVCLTACAKTTEISKQAIDCEFIPAHYQTIVTFLIVGKTPIPQNHIVYVNETYKIKYEITYSDGKSKTKWVETSKEEYEKIKGELVKNDNR